jgi:hypothetical protein
VSSKLATKARIAQEAEKNSLGAKISEGKKAYNISER